MHLMLFISVILITIIPSRIALLSWKIVTTKMPWGVVILIGGGFALAEICKVLI